MCMFFIGNRFKKRICLFLNRIVELLLFCLYMSVIPIKYVYTMIIVKDMLDAEMVGYILWCVNLCKSVQKIWILPYA